MPKQKPKCGQICDEAANVALNTGIIHQYAELRLSAKKTYLSQINSFIKAPKFAADNPSQCKPYIRHRWYSDSGNRRDKW